MKYSKVGLLGVIMLSSIFTLTGCKEKGSAFIGHWMQIQVKEDRKPASLDIELDDGVFHVNYSWHTAFVIQEGDETLRTRKLEAKAESDTVLTVITKFNQTMRLNEDVISFDNKEFKKQN